MLFLFRPGGATSVKTKFQISVVGKHKNESICMINGNRHFHQTSEYFPKINFEKLFLFYFQIFVREGL